MAKFSYMDSSFVPINDQIQHFIPTAVNPNVNNFGDGFNPSLNNVEATFSQFSPFSQGLANAAINSHSGYSEEMGQHDVNLGNHGGSTAEAGPQANPQSYPYAYTLDPRAFLQLPHWPDTAVPFRCSNCRVLREIIHTNGVDFTRFEIHGTLGFIAHGILNYKYSSDPQDRYLMVDFSQRHIDEIKDFLTKYCQNQSVEGFVVVADPYSSYYEALTIGLEWTEDFNDDIADQNPTTHEVAGQNQTTLVFPDPNPSTSGGTSEYAEPVAGARYEAERNVRFSLAAQRERAANLSLDDMKDYFHVPIEEAARHLNLCITVVKKICRNHGVGRWPYRKVSSIVKQISVLRKNLETQNDVTKTRTQAEIDRLMDEMVQNCGGVTPTTLNFE